MRKHKILHSLPNLHLDLLQICGPTDLVRGDKGGVLVFHFFYSLVFSPCNQFKNADECVIAIMCHKSNPIIIFRNAHILLLVSFCDDYLNLHHIPCFDASKSFPGHDRALMFLNLYNNALGIPSFCW